MLRCRNVIDNSAVLILGAGPGVEAQAVAMLGAKQVIATDIHPTTLQLLRYDAQQAGLDNIIHCQGEYVNSVVLRGVCLYTLMTHIFIMCKRLISARTNLCQNVIL